MVTSQQRVAPLRERPPDKVAKRELLLLRLEHHQRQAFDLLWEPIGIERAKPSKAVLWCWQRAWLAWRSFKWCLSRFCFSAPSLI